jgi:ribosomal protein S16
MKKNQILVKYYSYSIRLQRQGRKGKSFFKIVVVNSNNRIIESLGYIMPHISRKNKVKPIGLNRFKCIFWLIKNAVPSYFIFFLFENLGLIKYNVEKQ